MQRYGRGRQAGLLFKSRRKASNVIFFRIDAGLHFNDVQWVRAWIVQAMHL